MYPGYPEKIAIWDWFKKWDTDRPGCTLFPEGAWHHCCVAHDYAYADHAGESLFVKCKIDASLRECVAATGHPGVARLMFLGVSVFGWIPWLIRYREARCP